jgi:phytoene dehydrogenase-like protein
MAANYDPRDAVSTWPVADETGAPIEYSAAVTKVEDKTSKKTGNPMEVWSVTVYGAEGDDREIKEYVVIPGATFKIKQLARALGRVAEFDAGTFHAEDHLGEMLKVHLAIEEQEGFDERNKIGKYLPASKPADGASKAERPNWQQAPPRGNSPIEEKKVFQEADIPF